MVRKARIPRTKARFVRIHQAINGPRLKSAQLATHEHVHPPALPEALKGVLRKPLQTSQAKTFHKNRRKSQTRKQALSVLSELLQQRIAINHSWAGSKIHPITLLAWLASEEPINGDFLVENTALLAGKLEEEIDPVFATQLDDVISRFLDAGITDESCSQDNVMMEIPKDFSMVMTPEAIFGNQDHDAMMTDFDAKMNASNKIVGLADSFKTTKHGFDPVQVLQKHAITFREPVDLPRSTLVSDIHVLFREENFHGCPQHIFEVLKPGLQLASLFLTHRATSAFWHTMMFGRREPISKGMSQIFSANWARRMNQAWSTGDYLSSCSQQSGVNMLY